MRATGAHVGSGGRTWPRPVWLAVASPIDARSCQGVATGTARCIDCARERRFPHGRHPVCGDSSQLSSGMWEGLGTIDPQVRVVEHRGVAAHGAPPTFGEAWHPRYTVPLPHLGQLPIKMYAAALRGFPPECGRGTVCRDSGLLDRSPQQKPLRPPDSGARQRVHFPSPAGTASGFRGMSFSGIFQAYNGFPRSREEPIR